MMIWGVSLATCAVVAAASLQEPLLIPHISSAKKPLVNSTELQDSITVENLLARAKHLSKIADLSQDQYNHPTRVIGSRGHQGTLEYIISTLAGLGDFYTTSNQSFAAVTGNVFESRLVIGSDVPKSAAPMGLTPPTKDKEPVHGPIVLVSGDGCHASDYPSNVTKSIALIRRGNCPFGDKSELAGKAGAIAAVVYNNENGSVQGTLGAPSPDHVATFGLSGEEAAPYIARLQKGKPLDGIAYMDAEVAAIQTTNIIAQTVDGDPDNCVMLGGHSDSVAEGPGINDDGSGSLSLLEVAAQLTNYSVNNCVRFAWWAGEEEGLLGSDYYVSVLPEEENLKIRLFMDYDMMASPNFAYQIYNATNAANPDGSEELRNLYVDWYKRNGLNYTFIPFDGRSDYDGFIRNGIPGGGIATGAEGIKTKEEELMFGGKSGEWYDPCYHSLCDTVDNLSLISYVTSTRLIAHSVATYAISFEGFPKRSQSISTEGYARDVKYHGHKLRM
ncbi:Zn-dependent exopeptidase [Aulographum hederae CBS 113979]|uniref:Peptide hydrolase n=1 Tax=Aulographum hederae CBS 113979 TaxID=1176131 RepID=A0A6G1GLE2_9PEZI|nr:Zn-dependent exopeptidase [Aulographum hederae CBS 113979]